MEPGTPSKNLLLPLCSYLIEVLQTYVICDTGAFILCTAKRTSPRMSHPSTYTSHLLTVLSTSNLVGDLDDRRSGLDDIVGENLLVVASSKDGVALSVDSRWNNGGKASLGWGSRGIDWSKNSDESSVERGHAVLWLEGVAWRQEGDFSAVLDSASGTESKGGERLDGSWELAQAGAIGCIDEHGSEGEDLIEVERVIEWLGERRLLERSADVCVVACLNRQD